MFITCWPNSALFVTFVWRFDSILGLCYTLRLFHGHGLKRRCRFAFVPCAVKWQVLATNDGVVGRNGGLTGSYETTSTLVCDACAARTFPETSVRPSGEIRFRCAERALVLLIGLGSVGCVHVSLAPIVSSSLFIWFSPASVPDHVLGLNVLPRHTKPKTPERFYDAML